MSQERPPETAVSSNKQPATNGFRPSGVAQLRHWLLHPGPRLSQRVVHAGFWAFALRITLRIFTTARTVILARLLAPGDFGLMGVALLMMSLLETFTQTGFKQALVQRKGEIRPYLDTAWTMQVLRSAAMAVLLVLAAPFVADFFDAPGAALIVRVMAIATLIGGLSNVGIVYFQKELEFQKRFLLQMSQTVAGVGVGIGMAFALHSVWALVYGELASVAAMVTASYVLHPYRPRPRLDWARAKELFGFGKWVLGSSMLGYLLHNLDRLVVGRVLGVVSLGLYQMAYNLSQLMTSELTIVTSQVAFPVYSKLQGSLDDLRRAYLRTLQFIALLSFPMAGGLYFLAPYFTPVVLGEKWMPMVAPFQVLIIWGLILSLSAATGPLFLGLGRPEVATKLQFVKLLIFGALVFPLTITWGLMGAAWAVVANALVVDTAAIYLANRLIGAPARSLGHSLGYPALSTLAMLLVISLAQWSLGLEASVGQLALLVVLGIVAYAGGIGVSRVTFGYNAGGILADRGRSVVQR